MLQSNTMSSEIYSKQILACENISRNEETVTHHTQNRPERQWKHFYPSAWADGRSWRSPAEETNVRPPTEKTTSAGSHTADWTCSGAWRNKRGTRFMRKRAVMQLMKTWSDSYCTYSSDSRLIWEKELAWRDMMALLLKSLWWGDKRDWDIFITIIIIIIIIMSRTYSSSKRFRPVKDFLVTDRIRFHCRNLKNKKNPSVSSQSSVYDEYMKTFINTHSFLRLSRAENGPFMSSIVHEISLLLRSLDRKQNTFKTHQRFHIKWPNKSSWVHIIQYAIQTRICAVSFRNKIPNAPAMCAHKRPPPWTHVTCADLWAEQHLVLFKKESHSPGTHTRSYSISFVSWRVNKGIITLFNNWTENSEVIVKLTASADWWDLWTLHLRWNWCDCHQRWAAPEH